MQDKASDASWCQETSRGNKPSRPWWQHQEFRVLVRVYGCDDKSVRVYPDRQPKAEVDFGVSWEVAVSPATKEVVRGELKCTKLSEVATIACGSGCYLWQIPGMTRTKPAGIWASPQCYHFMLHLACTNIQMRLLSYVFIPMNICMCGWTWLAPAWAMES